MIKSLNAFAAQLGIVATLHFSVADLAYAETTQEMKDAAAGANVSTFKPSPSDLYDPAQTDSVAITGVTTSSGPLSLSPSDMFYGVPGQTAEEGALPEVDTYEDLYGYRDQQLGNLEAGSGAFSATGELNAEAAAVEVLNQSVGAPSVSAQEFLLTSREILADGSESTAEFGECIIQQVTGTNTYTYDNSETESCDTLGYNQTPMYASRIYNGPESMFSYTENAGVRYCSDGTNSVQVDAAETCGKLAILTSVPTSPNGGTISARSCSGDATCVELLLDQNGSQTPVSITFTLGDRVAMTDAAITAAGLTENGWVSYQGNTFLSSDGTRAAPEVISSQGQTQTVGVFGGTRTVKVRDPASGEYYEVLSIGPNTQTITAFALSGQSPNWGHFFWKDVFVSERSTGKSGGVYYLDSGECRYMQGSLRGSRAIGSDGDRYVYYYGVYRLCDAQEIDTSATAVVRLNFTENDLFTAWAFNASRWSEIQEIGNADGCSINFIVEETAAKSNGCVNAFGGSSGRNGEICGDDIPVAPFTMLSDRAATRVRVEPSCVQKFEGNADGAFTEASTCQAYEDDPACSFVGRECLTPLSSGGCLVYENTYSCGEIMTYDSPTVEEVNICNSSLSCLGDDCIPNTGTDGSLDIAKAAGQLAAADMLMSDMTCSTDLNESVNAEADIANCELFKGSATKCRKITLGLANCCDTADGVSLADYLQLAFAVSRLSRIVQGSSLANPVTSAWLSLEDLGRNSFSSLTRPLTEVWESVIGSTDAAASAANAISLEAVKQTMMKKAAQWTAQMFGEQAANAIFTVNGGAAFAGTGSGILESGTIGLTQSASAIMGTVMMAYTIYTLLNVLADILFACNEDEQVLMVKRALKSTHKIGTYCSTRVLGACVNRKTTYCHFASPLSRIMNEQARAQTGLTWGTPQDPNCAGITVSQFQSLDPDLIDLSEWTGMLVASGMVDTQAVADIESLTGTDSTLGKALEDLYTRENAVDRNLNKLDGVDLDAARDDAVSDYGMGITR